MKKLKEFLIVYSIGAAVYSIIEILWRGYTHWTMSILGGACFSFIYVVADKFKKLKLWAKCLFSSVFITVAEFVVGLIVNRIFKMDVWDYSEEKFNLLGQICLLYSVFWYLLCIPATLFAKMLNKKLRKT